MTQSVTWIGTPHRGKGRQGYRPEAVVIHIIEGSLAASAPGNAISAR